MNYETQISADAAEFVDDAASSRRRKIVIAVIVLLVVAALAWKIFGGKGGEATQDQAAQVPVVTVLSPGSSNVDRVVNATGSIAARREMPVAVVGEGGRVVSVLVEPGTWVGKGQVLAVIERSVQTQQIASLAAQVDVARADAKLAQAELDRAKALVERGFISKSTIDQRTATRDAANARVNVAIAQLQQQRAATARLDIRAPEAGLILTRAVEPGQVVSAGSGVLFRMAKGGELEMMARVGESDMSRVGVGGPARVRPMGSAAEVEGHVWQVAPVIDPQTRQGMIRILLPRSNQIRPGGFASATIISGSGNAPLLPESAVQSDDKTSYVYIVNAQNKVERRNVTVGQVSDRGVSIIAGITGRERIVATAGAFLNPGQTVKPELAKTAF